MTILQLRLRRQWQALLLCSHLIFPGTSDFLHLEKEYSKRRAHKKMLQLIERIRATARGIGRANNRERGEAGQKDIRLFRTNIVGSAFLSLWVEKQEIEFEGERKTYGRGEWYCTGCLGDGTRVVGFLARYWLVVTVKGCP